MARITVEDCLDYVDNRFELVLLGSTRARQIATGGKEPMVAEDKDKPTVLALREIAEGLVKPSILQEQEDAELEDVDLEFTDDQATTEESGEPPSFT